MRRRAADPSWAVLAATVLALLVWIGKSTPNDGRVSDAAERADAGTSVSALTLGSIDALLGADEHIVSVQSVDVEKGDDGTRYVVDAMVYDRAHERQRLERIEARAARGKGVVLTQRTPVSPIPTGSDKSLTFAPTLSQSKAGRAYPLERPGTFEFAPVQAPGPETFDFSALDEVQPAPMTDLYDSLATDKSSFHLQYG